MRGSGARLTLNSAGNCQPYTPNNHCSSESLCQCNPLWPFSSLSVIFRRLLCVKNPECVTAELLQGKRYVHLTSLAVLTTFRLFIYYFGVFFLHASPCVLLRSHNSQQCLPWVSVSKAGQGTGEQATE